MFVTPRRRRPNSAFGKGKGKQGKGKHGKGKGTGKQGQQGQQGRDRSKDKDKSKDSIECWNCGKRGHHSKDCWSKKNANKGGSNRKHKSNNADAHNLNLDSTKPANVEPEVEIGGFDMSFLDVDTLQQQGSEWIKIGVDTGAGKTAWPQSVKYGKKLPGHVDLTFHTATGELVKSGERLYVEGCDDWRVNLRVRGFLAPVCKPLLSVVENTTMGGVTVLCGDKGYMFHQGSNVSKKIDAWTQKQMIDSHYYGCTVAYKENNVYNIYLKPRGNMTDAMPVSEDSDNRSSGDYLTGWVRTRKTGESRSRRSRRSTRSNAR